MALSPVSSFTHEGSWAAKRLASCSIIRCFRAEHILYSSASTLLHFCIFLYRAPLFFLHICSLLYGHDEIVSRYSRMLHEVSPLLEVCLWYHWCNRPYISEVLSRSCGIFFHGS